MRISNTSLTLSVLVILNTIFMKLFEIDFYTSFVIIESLSFPCLACQYMLVMYLLSKFIHQYSYLSDEFIGMPRSSY